ncbi:MAG: hypothetical protein JWO86_7983 [Myxococcaceae bacterium]|jgi:hypothetical protein|nr:hypothetical protein [Myxococcaceae bacterium]MEA2746874.1 hypothetical protein [Myxococcales bacterium]
MNALRWFFFSLLSMTLSLAAVPGCGGSDKTDVKSPTAEPSMDDALALLPGNAIAVGTVDARAFFSSQTFGADLAKLVEKYVPIGTEAGFQASRDVDRVTFASYSYQGIDVAAIVIGRFDSAKIKQVATSQTPTKNGGTLVVSQYTGRDVYTVNNIGFTLLSDTRAIVGTEQGIRRVLERINDKRVKRDIAPWMISTVETSGAALAVAADFASTPIPPENAKQIPSPLITNLKAARLVATFKDGVNLAGSITYADAASAEQSAAVVKQGMGYAKLLAVFGVKLQNVDVKTDKSDVQVSLLVDDQSLRALLAQVPSLMGQ